jgi:hypothetical protein
MAQVAIVPVSWPTRAAFIADVSGAFMRQGLAPASAAILTAHVALSTGWGKAADNYRLAGIKLCSGCENQYDYTVVSGTEVVNGVETPKTPMKWRSFSTLDEGAAAVVGLLRQPRYASAWAMLQAGDPEYFAEVGRNGWYTASTAQMKAEMSVNLAAITKQLGITPAVGSDLSGLLLFGGVAWLTWWLLKRYF